MNTITTLDFIDVPSRREMEESMTRKYLRTDNLGYIIKNKVIVNGTGIFNKDDTSPINHLEGTWVFLGKWLSIWGHCITDNLKKIWFLRSHYFNELERGGLCISSFTTIHKNFAYLLNILGVGCR